MNICTEEVFGRIKTVGGLRKARRHGADRFGRTFTFVAGAYNLGARLWVALIKSKFDA